MLTDDQVIAGLIEYDETGFLPPVLWGRHHRTLLTYVEARAAKNNHFSLEEKISLDEVFNKEVVDGWNTISNSEGE